MKIEKADVMLMVGCALAGIAFMNVVALGSIWASMLGIICGAGGGCVVCIFRRLLKRHRERIEKGMRTGIPKYSGAWSVLAALGFWGFLLQRLIGSADCQWFGMLGGVCLAVAMAVMVAGMVAERRQAEKKEDPEQAAGRVR